jgi:hypothetical protein
MDRILREALARRDHGVEATPSDRRSLRERAEMRGMDPTGDK